VLWGSSKITISKNNDNIKYNKDLLGKAMKRIKFILKLIVFLCIFFILLGSISYSARPDSDMKERFAGFYSEPKNTIDVIAIGASPISPLLASPYIWNEYGITSYPLSTNAQPVAAVKYIIEDAHKTQKDSLFIVDTTMFMVETDVLLTEPRIRNVVDNMKYSLTRVKAIKDMVEDKNKRIDYYFDISKYHSAILGKNGLNTDDIKYFDFKNESIYKGYLFTEAVDIFEPVSVEHITEVNPMPESAEAVLVELMNYCEKKDISLLFITCPYIASEDNKMEHNYIENLVLEHGYDYLDFNDLYEEMDIDFGKDFYNTNHMNVYGAEKFSKYLGNYLKDNYKLQDKKGYEGYEAWDESYIVWKEKADISKKNTDENLDKLNNK